MTRNGLKSLSCFERRRLVADLARSGIPAKDIAAVVGRHQSTVFSVLSQMRLTFLSKKRFDAIIDDSPFAAYSRYPQERL